MQLKQGFSVDPTQVEVVSLAGQERIIPLLAMRQNRVVVPLMLEVLPVIERAGVGGDDPSRASDVLAAYSEGMIEKVVTIVYTALTRAYDITLEEFLDLPIGVAELMNAVPKIVKQTAFFKPREPGQPAGETLAAG